LADKTDAEEESDYKSEAEENYFNHLELALAEPEEKQRGLLRKHYFFLPVEGQEEEEYGWGKNVGFT
jgi:hypothetical protein